MKKTEDIVEIIGDSQYGGQYVIESLISPLEELTAEFQKAYQTPAFSKELDYYLSTYTGRPTPLHFAKRLTSYCNGAKIFLKREDLNHTGSHKINNTIGQLLLAKRMGKSRVIAETGAGQHGVATATAAALFNLKCDIFMGRKDMERQSVNLLKMKALGANVIPVDSGSQTLKDAMSEAIRNWIATSDDTHYLVGSVAGPAPFPKIVRKFQSVIGEETKLQWMVIDSKLPDYLVAVVGGGSNALGLFHPFYEENDVKMIGVEAAGKGLESNEHSASITYGKIGVLHGSKSYVMTDDNGQVMETHSIAAGLDYPGVGPEHAWYKDSNRAEYVTIDDNEALSAFKLLTVLEGIIPALESAHAIAHVVKLAKQLKRDQSIVVSLSGRGDKDVETVLAHFNK